MAPPVQTFPEPPTYRIRRPIGGRVLAGVAVAALVASVWWAAQQQSTTTRKPAEDSVLIPVVPPAPPPPPPPEQAKPQPRPEEVQPQPAPPQAQPTPAQPSPQPQGAPAQAGQAVSVDAPAQAGSDAFSIGAGSGSGQRGSGVIGNGLGGFNRAAYAGYLEGELRKAWQNDPRLRDASLRARVRIWIDPKGQITRVEAQGTDLADAIRQSLVGKTVRPPDPSLAMPITLSLDIRRSG